MERNGHLNMEQYVSECPFLNTKPTVSNIESNLKYLLLLNQENWEKSKDDVMHKHDSVKDAQTV